MTEASIERSCRLHAQSRGVLSFKLQGYIAGDPDRVFLLPRRRVWLVEFKSPEGRVSPRQVERHRELAAAGHPVTVVRSTIEFRALLDSKLGATAQ